MPPVGDAPIDRPHATRVVEAWLKDPVGSRFFLIEGLPGTGKSVLTSILAKGAAGLRAAARHHCQFVDGRSISPHGFVESLAAQLVSDECFTRALLAGERRREIRIEVRQDVESSPGARVTGLHVEKIVLGDISAEDAFFLAVRRPLEAAAEEHPERTWFLVIDGLDEGLLHSGPVNILDLLGGTMGLPPNVRVVVTSRPDERVRRRLRPVGMQVFRLDDEYPGDEVRAEIERLILANLERAPDVRERLAFGFTPQACAAVAADRAERSFLHATFVVELLRLRQGSLGPDALAEMPQELGELYAHFIERLCRDANDWRARYAPLLGSLAVAREPLTEGQLGAMAGIGAGETRARLGILRQLLATDEGRTWSERTYALFHRSFAEFLLNGDCAGDFWCPAGEQHGRIMDWALGNASDWGVVVWNQADPYVLRHLLAHTCAGDPTSASLKAAEAILGPSYLSAKQACVGSSAIIGDLQLAVEHSREATDCRRTLRFGLILAFWRDRLAMGASPAMAPILVKLGENERAMDLLCTLEKGGRGHADNVDWEAEAAQKGVALALADVKCADEAVRFVERATAPQRRCRILMEVGEALAERDPVGALKIISHAQVSAVDRCCPQASPRLCGLLAAHPGLEGAARDLAGDSEPHLAAVAVALGAQNIDEALDVVMQIRQGFREDAVGYRLNIRRHQILARTLTRFVRVNPGKAWFLAERNLKHWDYVEGLLLSREFALFSPTLGKAAFDLLMESYCPETPGMYFLNKALAIIYLWSAGGSKFLANTRHDIEVDRANYFQRAFVDSNGLECVLPALSKIDVVSLASTHEMQSLLSSFAERLLAALKNDPDVPEYQAQAAGVLGIFFAQFDLVMASSFISFVEESWQHQARYRAIEGVTTGLALRSPALLFEALEKGPLADVLTSSHWLPAVEALADRDPAAVRHLIQKVPKGSSTVRRNLIQAAAEKLNSTQPDALRALLALSEAYVDGATFTTVMERIEWGLAAANPCGLLTTPTLIKVPPLVQAQLYMECADTLPQPERWSMFAVAADLISKVPSRVGEHWCGQTIWPDDVRVLLAAAHAISDVEQSLEYAVAIVNSDKRRAALRCTFREFSANEARLRGSAEHHLSLALHLHAIFRRVLRSTNICENMWQPFDITLAACLELDPSQAAALLLELEVTDPKIVQYIRLIFLIEDDGDAAFRLLEADAQLGNNSDKLSQSHMLRLSDEALARAAQHDPARAMNWWHNQDNSLKDMRALNIIMTHWPLQNWPDALTVLNQIESNCADSLAINDRYGPLSLLAQRLATINLDQALAMTKNIANNWERENVVRYILRSSLKTESMTPDHLAKIIKRADCVNDSELRERAFGYILETSKSTSRWTPETVVKILASLALGDRNTFLHLVDGVVRLAVRVEPPLMAQLQPDLTAVRTILEMP